MEANAVILDRDGTIIAERNYLSRPDQVELLPGAVTGLRRLQTRGFLLIMATNQSGLGRGYFTEADLRSVHDRLRRLLADEGVALDGIYYCPHCPEYQCNCRKPRTGMVDQAAADFGFDPSKAIVIGDKPCDIELGQALGARTILVRTGYGSEYASNPDVAPHHVTDDLDSAADFIDCLMAHELQSSVCHASRK